MKKGIIIGLIALVVLAGASYFLFLKSPSDSPTGNVVGGVSKFEVYKSEYCGCCDLFVKYAKKFANLEIKDVTDVNPKKDELGIPQSMRSCHTTIIGDYFAEGHIPIEAINKLLSEKPDIKGIALPGMPAGSPGMPGGKTGDFVVYAIHNDGSTSEFMRI